MCASLLPCLLIASGCGDDPESPAPREVSFEVSATRLPSLPFGKGHYEAWIAFPEPDEGKASGAPRAIRHGELEMISIGKFLVGATGGLVGLDGEQPAWALRIERDVNLAAEAWISIEPEGDADTIPEGLLIASEVTGTETRGVASLTVAHRHIFDLEADANLAAFSGIYTLETPSDADTTNEALGFYFSSGDTAGLDLPELDGEKVVYEAWLEALDGSERHSSGRFTAVEGLDSDGPGFGAGGEVDSFPGQEFVMGAPLVLNDGSLRLSVTLEPTNDNDTAAPSPFVLFRSTIGSGQPTGVPVAMQNVTDDLPIATIVINR